MKSMHHEESNKQRQLPSERTATAFCLQSSNVCDVDDVEKTFDFADFCIVQIISGIAADVFGIHDQMAAVVDHIVIGCNNRCIMRNMLLRSSPSHWS